MESFFKYIKNPIPLENTERFTLSIYLKTIWLCYFLVFISSVFLVVFKYLNLLPHYLKPEVNSITIFLIVTVFGPLFEEILCRLNLRISKLNIAAFVSVLITLIIKLLYFRGVEFQFFLYLGALLFFLLIYYAINRYDLPMVKIETFWKSNFKYIFHLSSIAFGLLHLTNFETVYWWMIAISPLISLPYIAIGYVLGYIRIKYGFIYGWLIHSSINFISVLLAIHKGIIIVLLLGIVLVTTNYFIQKIEKNY